MLDFIPYRGIQSSRIRIAEKGGNRMEKENRCSGNSAYSESGNSPDGKRECCCHTGRKKDRSEKEYKDLIHRLNRIEGQIRGVRGMVEKDAYCTDILTQVAAASAALNSFSRKLLENHIRTCVTQDILDGKEETVDELLAILQKLMK